ncbi:MAG: hypothetical protein IJ822_04375 [Pyramidobacter sp.]|nr:hypothetical protein [Pyramidobacter sp.]MBQ8129424.1 hypothetical protein [Clostridia bacterium]MBR1895996.1 hypothetical protein [Pyramidobacter sp.]
MKMLAFLTAANVAVLPAACPLLAGLTVVAIGAAWLAWPVMDLLEALA